MEGGTDQRDSARLFHFKLFESLLELLTLRLLLTEPEGILVSLPGLCLSDGKLVKEAIDALALCCDHLVELMTHSLRLHEGLGILHRMLLQLSFEGCFLFLQLPDLLFSATEIEL